MNIAVWIVTGLLALLFLGAGAMKIIKPKAELVEAGQGWAADFPDGVVKFIGVAEVLGAIGLVLPALVDIATWLVPAAAIGLVVVMAGAIVTHLRRSELPNVGVNVVLLALAAFVAVERIGPAAF